MDKQAQLDQIAADILSGNVCPDLAKNAQLVMGHGSLDADIFIIGEAPGKEEDEQGIPFAGKAGKILNEQLQNHALPRDELFISNIVKYRPPGNRDPSPQEKVDFWPYLEQEIALVDPKMVVTLGRHSLSSFLPDVKIGDVHGVLHEREIAGKQRVFIPMYHPISTIYDKERRAAFAEDFTQLKAYLKNKHQS